MVSGGFLSTRNCAGGWYYLLQYPLTVFTDQSRLSFLNGLVNAIPRRPKLAIMGRVRYTIHANGFIIA